MTNRTFQVWSSNHHGSTSCLQPVTTRIWATVGHSDACCPGTTTGGASSKVNDKVQVQQLCLAGANYHDTEPSTKNRNMPQNHHRKKKKSIKRGRSQSYSQRPNALVEWQPYTCLTTRGESKTKCKATSHLFFATQAVDLFQFTGHLVYSCINTQMGLLDFLDLCAIQRHGTMTEIVTSH